MSYEVPQPILNSPSHGPRCHWWIERGNPCEQAELRAVYADSVREHLAGTISEPFAAGEHQQIAVKVIGDRSNELLVVKKLSAAEEQK